MLSRGFSLIEVLASLLILGLGMLGIVALAAQGQQSYIESAQRSEAVRYAEEMADRIRANSGLAANPALIAFYVDPAGSATPDELGDGSEYQDIFGASPTGVNCVRATTGAGCSSTQLALFDRAWWDGLLAGQVTELGLTSPVGCITQVAGAVPRVRITVAWQGLSDTTDSAGAGGTFAPITCGDAAFGVGVASRRMVSLEVAL